VLGERRRRRRVSKKYEGQEVGIFTADNSKTLTELWVLKILITRQGEFLSPNFV